MRIQLQLSPNYKPLPFNHLHQLTGALHKWLGPNEVHDGLSLYSFGWLRGGEKVGGGLMFPNGATWEVSFLDISFSKRLMMGIINQPEVTCGMTVTGIQEVGKPEFSEGRNRLWASSPIVVRKKREDGSRAYLTWEDPEADKLLTQITHKKLVAAGMETLAHETNIQFDKVYPNAQTKLIAIKEIKHRGSFCPVVVDGPSEVAQFIWLTGVGELTGSGFGAIR